MGDDKDKSNFSLLDLFRTEVSEQGKVLTEGLLSLEGDNPAASQLEALMRAAHSVKGAARLVGVEPVVRLAHVIEDVFVAAQNSELALASDHVDILLKGVDMIASISGLAENEIAAWEEQHKGELDGLLKNIAAIKSGDTGAEKKPARKKTEPAANRNKPLADSSMLDLFRIEITEQGKVLTDGLLALEADPSAADRLEALMRAAHSIKGAARMVGVDPVVRLAHVIEDVFVAAQNAEIVLAAEDVDLLLKGIDTVLSFAALSDAGMAGWAEDHGDDLEKMLGLLSGIRSQEKTGGAAKPEKAPEPPTDPPPSPQSSPASGRGGERERHSPIPADEPAGEDKDRVLRVTAERWNQLMGLAGEVKVEAGWLHPYVVSLNELKRRQVELVEILDSLRSSLDDMRAPKTVIDMLLQAQGKISECRRILADQTSDLDSYDRRINNLSEKLHRETIKTRMRPFSDGVHGFQRMVRDIAKSLGKKVKLEINGLSVQVDRDVLEKMEAPLNHILRNALDHGVDLPEERAKAGKPEQATIRITATHSDGMLSIIVDDDGRGIDLEHLRKKVIEKKLVTPEMATKLNEEELLEFLFLPSFSTRDEVTDLSGRGVGLDVVLSTIQKMRGSVETTTKPGEGTRFHMRLPLTMSVISSLIAEISGEPYAFPLARIIRAAKLPSRNIDVLEDHQFVEIDGENIGLVGASQVLGLGPQVVGDEELSVIIIGDRHNRCGVVVDKLLGQKELAIQPLDSRLGKVQDVGAAAVLEDGSPVLILDVDDLVLSVDSLVRKGGIAKVTRSSGDSAGETVKNILVVDDSRTVREVERNLLENAGYRVDVAVDGVDGWNAIRAFKKYDLIVTDIDMPRMDGIELVRLVKCDRDFNSVPVIIVSYKEREEDRRRGMDVGADYYLTKGSFHDNSLLDAVADLIGEVEA
ncbi:MAG: hybrid sensor histidine kinase/response regulator [Gallionella sp.]|nr:MAG: hybrid sensor histidine kinase/response regulator [Gallionella sp.]